MNFRYANLDDCHTAAGVVIVIDVLRAFSTAAYAFSLGAREILLVGTVEQALALKPQIPASKIMGEVYGLRPEGFDFCNSPTYLSREDLSGITIPTRSVSLSSTWSTVPRSIDSISPCPSHARMES